MATLEDILAATKVIAETETLVSGSGSILEVDRVRNSEKRIEDNDGSATKVVVSKRVVEVETVVESPVDGVGELYSGLENQQGDEISVQSNGGMEPTVNEVGVEMKVDGYSVDEKIENREGSYANKGDAVGTNVEHLNGTVGKGLIEDVEGKGEGDIEKLEYQNHGFRVGDFVWGKIKSHPWWPGQIYDIKDASEFALKYSQEGRLLVAFFGDGSCSWCLPSQLVPFVEKFEDMCMDSRSRSFLNATQSALNEIGRIVESEMACSCIPEEKRGGLARPVVENAGIKAGVLMTEVDSGRFSIPAFKPVEMLSNLRDFAKVGCVDNALELAVLRSWLSAFYRFKCGGQLPVYRDPVPVEGLEDKNQNVSEVATDVQIEVPIGPAEEDWLSSPTKVTSDEKFNPRRKHKSIAALIKENTNIKPKSHKRATVIEGTDLVKETSSRKRRKSDDSSSMCKISVSESSEIIDNKIVNAETSDLGGVNGVNEEGSLKEKLKELEVSIPEKTPGEEKEALGTLSSPRERKKSKYLSPPFTNITWMMGNSSFKASKVESDEIDKKARLGFDKTKAKVENHSNGHSERSDTSVINSGPVENNKTLSFSIYDVDAPQDDFLSKIQRAAIDPLFLSKNGSFDTVFAFSSALRSATYSQGSDYEALRQCIGTKKRKSSSLQHKTPENHQKSPEGVKVECASKPKRKAKNSAGKVTVKTFPCLFMIFKHGSPLPPKEDIVKHFGKFGSLNERDTSVMPDSHLIQIVFMEESEATKAFKSSMSENSFGFENLVFDTVQLSPGSSSGGSCPKVPLPVMQSCDGSNSSDDLATDARVITNKLMIMTVILEKYQSKFSEEDKAILKEEMQRLMEKVENMSEKVDTVSEKARAKAEETSS